MMFVLGIAAFALCILISVALHECGHMWAARATGMKVRRYFVGFGPTLWSTRRPNKLGETEYGIKAIPAGGFCDIAGMTAIEELTPDERPYAMFKQKTWKRVAGECIGPSPAAIAGIQPGDVVVKVGNTNVANFDEMVTAVRKLDGPTPFVVERDGSEFTTTVDVTQTQRWVGNEEGADAGPSTVGAIGVSAAQFPPTQYNALSAVPATFAFTGDLAVELGKSLAKIPTKVGALVHAIGGGERDPETPISVVGASIIGGDAVDHDLWVAFWFFLAQINFVLGAINLIPLLPFDGGHIAIAVFEKIRNMIRSARRIDAAPPVNYLKLMPATYVILFVVVGYMLLTVTADLVNPIRLFQ